MSNFCLALFGVHHIGSLNSIIVRVNPENVFRPGIEINGLYSLLVIYHIHLFPGMQIVGPELGSVGEQHDNVIVLGATHAAMFI